MNKQEFSKIAMAMRTYYPNQNLLPNNEAMQLWYNQLQDIPYQVATIALNKWVSLNKWSPTIADLRAMASDVQYGDCPDWSEAWDTVIKNIRKYGSYRAVEGLEALQGITRKTVERLGYTHLCHCENVAVERASFRDIYNTLASREKENRQMSPMLVQAMHMLLEEKA